MLKLNRRCLPTNRHLQTDSSLQIQFFTQHDFGDSFLYIVHNIWHVCCIVAKPVSNRSLCFCVHSSKRSHFIRSTGQWLTTRQRFQNHWKPFEAQKLRSDKKNPYENLTQHRNVVFLERFRRCDPQQLSAIMRLNASDKKAKVRNRILYENSQFYSLSHSRQLGHFYWQVTKNSTFVRIQNIRIIYSLK